MRARFAVAAEAASFAHESWPVPKIAATVMRKNAVFVFILNLLYLMVLVFNAFASFIIRRRWPDSLSHPLPNVDFSLLSWSQSGAAEGPFLRTDRALQNGSTTAICTAMGG